MTTIAGVRKKLVTKKLVATANAVQADTVSSGKTKPKTLGGVGSARGLKLRAIQRATKPASVEVQPTVSAPPVSASGEVVLSLVPEFVDPSPDTYMPCFELGAERKLYNYETGQYYMGRIIGYTRNRPAKEALPLVRSEIIQNWTKDILTSAPKSNYGVSALMTNFNTGTTLGIDPEVFVVDSGGEIVPAWLVYPKKYTSFTNSHVRSDGGGQISVYSDGFGVEFSAYQNHCFGWLLDDFAGALHAINTVATGNGWKLCLNDSMPVNPVMLEGLPEERVQLGCSPSHNSYGGVPPMPNGRNLPFRTIGAHYHFGWSGREHMLGKVIVANKSEVTDYIARAMDFSAVILCAAMPGYQNPQRRTLYGRAGEYRTNSVKFEYRVHSSSILRHPLTTMLAAETSRALYKQSAGAPFVFALPPATTMQYAINNSDSVLCKEIIKAYPHLFFFALYGFNKAYVHYMFNLITSPEGLTKELNFSDEAVVDNWGIGSKSPNRWVSHAGGVDCSITNFCGRRCSISNYDLPTLTPSGLKTYTVKKDN